MLFWSHRSQMNSYGWIKQPLRRWQRVWRQNNEWTIPSTRLPIWCSVKSYLFAVKSICQMFSANNRQREKEEQEVYSMVEMIIDLLARHQTAMIADRRPHVAFLDMTHVRDVLVPLKERKTKLKLWKKAFSSLRTTNPKSSLKYNTLKADDTSSPTSFVMANSVVTLRPKVWQRQAFNSCESIHHRPTH